MAEEYVYDTFNRIIDDVELDPEMQEPDGTRIRHLWPVDRRISTMAGPTVIAHKRGNHTKNILLNSIAAYESVSPILESGHEIIFTLKSGEKVKWFLNSYSEVAPVMDAINTHFNVVTV